MKVRKSGIKDVIMIIRMLKNFPTYFADSFKPNKQKYIVLILRNGIKYKMGSETLDREILKEIWIQRAYTPKEFEIDEKDLVVDIGAHIGIFSIFASKFAKKGKIYAFEPVAENFEMLKHNIEINKIKNIIPINSAISDKTGQKAIFISKANTATHSFYSTLISVDKTENVHTICLGDFIEQNEISEIDFLKVDCEGAEYEILFSCPDKVLKIIRKISLEYHNLDKNRNAPSMKKFLEEKGFEVAMRERHSYMGYLYARAKDQNSVVTRC